MRVFACFAVTGVLLIGCSRGPDQTSQPAAPSAAVSDVARRVADYAPVRLQADLSEFSADDRQLLLHLVRAAELMNDLFWQQAWGDRDALLGRLADPAVRRFAEMNYGPWDRLAGNEPFVAGVGAKPPGANFYPAGMTAAEFNALPESDRTALYSLIRRDAAGRLVAIPYSQAFRPTLQAAAEHLRQAAVLSTDAGFAAYLDVRAQALLGDDYLKSDLAWMDMKSNRFDVVIGPIETYEDQLHGARAAFSGYVLIKDLEWSARLARFARLLPALQRELPVPAAYKRESPGTNSDLNAYDVIYYAGDANAGAKAIAVNLPNDERVQQQKGTRRLQLKNAMRAKFDAILMPIAGELIVRDQLANVRFDAFFSNIMFHEVAHGLGVNQTINGRGTVRLALKEQHSALEEAKADILGLHLVSTLIDRGELRDTSIADSYVTFVAGILRSVRFGAADAHGKANMIEFNYFANRGAFVRDAATGRYRIDVPKARAATAALAGRILQLQGDGDYEAARAMVTAEGVVAPDLQRDLERLRSLSIPVDVVFEQGSRVLGLE